jgi:hypothetical protein
MKAEDLKYFRAEYSNYPSPPPYLYQYVLELILKDGVYEARYELVYLEREEIEEDEIFEEGFTLNDDYSWSGKLPEVWIQEFKTLIEKTKDGQESKDNILLEVETEEGRKSFYPLNDEAWEYFLQEMIQAIYEIDQRESPFELLYKEISPEKEWTEIKLTASFANRKVEAILKGKEGNVEKEISWQGLKSLMEIVYLPDYDYEEANAKPPHKPGKYINTGEGLWFEFGNTI